MVIRNELLDPDVLTISISELLVATADAADPEIDQAIPDVLRMLRQTLRMDVVFVSEFVNGQRVFRFVDSAPGAPPVEEGAADPLETSYCQRVVDGRLPELVHDAHGLPGLPRTPFRVGAHLSTPIRLPDGRVYGTLCCFSTAPNPQLQQRDLTNLRHCALLVSRKVDAALGQGQTPAWHGKAA